MSIGSIGNLAPAFSNAPLLAESRTGRGPAYQPAALSYLTAGDREVLAAMFGPDALALGYDAAGRPVGGPKFVAILVRDRMTGQLPTGTEVSSSYLQRVWDQHGAGAVAGNPLTAQNLADGLDFLSRRDQGGRIDVRA